MLHPYYGMRALGHGCGHYLVLNGRLSLCPGIDEVHVRVVIDCVARAPSFKMKYPHVVCIYHDGTC